MSFLVNPYIVSPAGITEITFFASSTSTAATITAPASILPGDLIVLNQLAVGSGSDPTLVTPTGFTSIASGFILTNWRNEVCYKLAAGTEGGTSITGMDGALLDSKVMLVFRGNVAATSLVLSTPNSQYTTGNPTPQVVSASGQAAPLVVLGFYTAQNAVNPRDFSPAKDGEVNQSARNYIAYKIYNSSPADVTIDTDDDDGAGLVSLYFQMVA